MPRRRKTAGQMFDKDEGPIYFIAGVTHALEKSFEGDDFGGAAMHPYLLVAVNTLQNKPLDHVRSWLDRDVKILFDSGVFTTAMDHARLHGLSIEEALTVPPEQIVGFGELFERYVATMKEFGDRSWGYIELDQGGRENKIKLRAKLEKLGLRPIPVYHPINDGWDYFDELAAKYDRLCIGNIVQSRDEDRRAIVTTIWERKRRYPGLWIHLLGYTPNEWMNAIPGNSADSSSWMGAVTRGQSSRERSMLASLGPMIDGFGWEAGANLYSDPTSEIGGVKSTRLAAYLCAVMQRNWRLVFEAWAANEVTPYPTSSRPIRRPEE